MATKARRSPGSGGVGAQRVKRVLVAGAVLAAVVFAVQGGEYGTRDLMRLRTRRASLVATNDSLSRVIDSLRKYKRRIETDPALQERIAREEFGLVRGNKELLYKLSEL